MLARQNNPEQHNTHAMTKVKDPQSHKEFKVLTPLISNKLRRK
jgi:hypothetical protein